MPEPRIRPVTEPNDELRELLEPGRQAFGRVLNIFGTLAHHPKLLRSFSRLGTDLLLRGDLPAREREIVILRVGWRCRSVYEFGQHTVIGRQAGLTDDEIARLAEAGTDSGVGWSDDDAALLAFADEICATNDVTDATWDRLAARWASPQLIELLLLAGYYRMVSGLLNSVRVEVDPDVPGWPGAAVTT